VTPFTGTIPTTAIKAASPRALFEWADWKLVERYEDGRVHLYTISKTTSVEKNDVKEGNEERVKEMRAKLHAWYKDTDAKFLQKKKGQEEEPWRP
jgi:isocitrate dehydrogenase kinase/phosphatase